MKISNLLLCAFSLLISSAAFAQSASVPFTANATIEAAMGITNPGPTPLSFGSLSVTAAGGTATVADSAAGTRSYTGGVAAGNATPVASAAMFTVTGTGSDTYAITLTMPSASLASGANTMALTLLSSVGLTSTLSSGTQTFYVGGTLTVGPSQVAGNYTSSGFTVAVNYN